MQKSNASSFHAVILSKLNTEVQPIPGFFVIGPVVVAGGAPVADNPVAVAFKLTVQLVATPAVFV
jgi:hypothetical protein